jgi:hypothetical protein
MNINSVLVYDISSLKLDKNENLTIESGEIRHPLVVERVSISYMTKT